MNRCSFCEWIPILPWPVWPLAGHARLGQNTVAGSMTILLSWLCWGACQEKVCLDPRFLCNLTLPRLSVELPIHRVRGRPPLLAAGIKSLIHSHSSSVRSLGYIFLFIYPFYTTHEDFSDRLLEQREVESK